MGVFRLIIKEISYRWLSFCLGLTSVGVAVACFVGAVTLLENHDLRTEQIITAKEAETCEKMAQLEDDYRKITKNMGFNLLVLPKDQNLSDFYADDYAAKFMPEEYVEKLAESQIMSVQHLLPHLQQKVDWPERKRTIILTGIRGEVPLLHREPKKPIVTQIPPGTMAVGYELHRSMDLHAGDVVQLLGRDFTIATCRPEQGGKDDITVWINLSTAQELFGKKGKINGILALKCHCVGVDLVNIRVDIGKILPDTQVVEFASKAVARAEARDRAAVEAEQAIAREKKFRARQRSEREAFAAMLVPLVVFVSAVFVGLLALGNVRERRAEIGIWRALGLRSSQILAIFMTKAVIMGLLGAVLGFFAGAVVGTFWAEPVDRLQSAPTFFNSGLFLAVLLCAPGLSALACWVPAMLAARQDPAVVLREE